MIITSVGGGMGETAMAFLLLVIKPMGSHSSELINLFANSSALWFLVSDRAGHYHMPNSVVLT